MLGIKIHHSPPEIEEDELKSSTNVDINKNDSDFDENLKTFKYYE